MLGCVSNKKTGGFNQLPKTGPSCQAWLIHVHGSRRHTCSGQMLHLRKVLGEATQM